ncbi:hypothetical protein GF359_08245 [candidate division WOR-3 bacterium]|uniref:Uncharacterized protein n=1 Tax=candidate division WOR-3 bacterium TaxID=2052148 RepID=A0A9D5KA38_UNCW3|nr:hypothetical protein [candidate division WOR-3 bacterium]MBD3365191.1 hypothetical protein [candidate division WOR-3 bacterium]
MDGSDNREQMKLNCLVIIVFTSSLFADSVVLLGGAGGAYNAGSVWLGEFEPVNRVWQVEVEAGYYTDREGIDVLILYAESLSKRRDEAGLSRDQQLTLMGEYRLLMLNTQGNLQGALGLGPSLRRFHYYHERAYHYPVRFNLQAGAGMLWFATRHLLIRCQAGYSFPALAPLEPGIVSLTLRAGFRF